MYRFKTTPQDLSDLVIDALNLFGHGIKEIWLWALLVAVFSLVGPYLIFESLEMIGPTIQATVRWSMMFLNVILSVFGAYCIGMIIRRLFLLGAEHEESVTQSMRLVLRKFPQFYLGLLLVSAIGVIGWMLIFFPGIFFAVIFAFVSPLILLDDYSIIKAFKESWHLVWGNWWRIFAMLLIPMLILVMVSALAVRDGTPMLNVIMHTLVMWFDIPLLLAFVLTMFYDTKLRHNVPLHLEDDGKKTKKKTKKQPKRS